MAEAILSVLKEGLSLSQAARKYDIPYPTFVLYANRVHNMLGPSADGGSGKYLNPYLVPYLRILRPNYWGEFPPLPQIIHFNTTDKQNFHFFLNIIYF